MKREDLRVTISYYDKEEDYWYMARTATDADLAALGYYRLDEIEGEAIETPTEWISIPVGSVDVEALRENVVISDLIGSDPWTEVMLVLARQVLAALDRKDEQ